VARALLSLAIVLAGCTATIPDGELVCEVAAPDCPDDFRCCPAASATGRYDGVCRRSACEPVDAGADAMDAGPAGDAGPFDAGSDAGADGGVDGGPRASPEEVVASERHTCLRLSDGTVECWGDNDQAQLGRGAATDMATTPMPVMGLSDVSVLEIEAGVEATCARYATGVRCWGDNRGPAGREGPLGADVLNSPTPIEVVLGATPPHRIAVGDYHACAVVGDDRAVECWGANNEGQLGIDSRTSQALPTPVGALDDVIDLCAAESHTCALRGDGTLHCWGDASSGRLGIGDPGGAPRRLVPTPVDGLSDVVDVECDYRHTCAITDDGLTRQAWCWGENQSGETQQLLETNPVLVPTALRDARGAMVDHIAAGGGIGFFRTEGFTLVWGASLALHGFGSNVSARLGVGGMPVTRTAELTPTAGIGADLIDVSAGAAHACAIEATAGGRRVLCWGSGADGRLGNADASGEVARPTPVFGYDAP